MEDKALDGRRQLCPELCGVSGVNFRRPGISPAPTTPQVLRIETVEDLREKLVRFNSKLTGWHG
jgi:hypothetical protein